MGLEKKRILVAEDEGLVAMTVEDMLSDLGCMVGGPAWSVPEALEMARPGLSDFALLDVSLQGKKVFPVAELLTEEGIPFAFASGYGVTGRPKAFCSSLVVPKSLEIEELSAALTAAYPG